MKKELIEYWIREGWLRIRSVDRQMAASLIDSARKNMAVVKTVQLSEESAPLIFRETYESIRQLGDAGWWLKGYEAGNHMVSMELLRVMDIKEKLRLSHLTRLRKIRNNSNYRGFTVRMAQAQEMLAFWDACAADIIALLEKEMRGK